MNLWGIQDQLPVFHPPVEVCIAHTSPVKAVVDGYPGPASSNVILARPTLVPRSRLPQASYPTVPDSHLQESHTRLGSPADVADTNFHAPTPSEYQNNETYSRASEVHNRLQGRQTPQLLTQGAPKRPPSRKISLHISRRLST